LSISIIFVLEHLSEKTDQVCVIPAGVPHCFRSVAGEAVFLETFSPGRIQNLVGFLGKIF